MRDMNIAAFHTKDGLPETGLTPVIDIWKVSDNSQVISADSMAEVGGGFYKYFFSGVNINEEYLVRTDAGGTISDAERYTFAGIEKDIRSTKVFSNITKTAEPGDEIRLDIALTEDGALDYSKEVYAGIYESDTQVFVEEVELFYSFTTNTYENTWTIPANALGKEYEIIFREKSAVEGRHFAVLDFGTSEALTATTLTDTDKSWTVDQFAGKNLHINVNGEELNITSNTATVLSFTGGTQTGVQPYFIYDYKCNILETLNIKVDILEDADGQIN